MSTITRKEQILLANTVGFNITLKHKQLTQDGLK